jgi:hypothetical protein
MINIDKRLGFETWQLLAITGLAISFWFNGVLLIRLITSYALWGGFGSATIFALSIPIALLSIAGVRRLLKLTSEQLSPSIILIVVLVTMLHGIALTWTPTIYGASGRELLFASAWLVWFSGAVLLPLLIMQQRAV